MPSAESSRSAESWASELAVDRTMTRPRDTILREIAREEKRLAELDQARGEARARRESLRSELEAASTPTPALLPLPLATKAKTPQTPGEKVRLFRSLFRGRQDIFPTRFVSKKTGKPGYAPECSNKFVTGLCILKTRGKCSECSNQGFVPVGDQVVLDHLRAGTSWVRTRFSKTRPVGFSPPISTRARGSWPPGRAELDRLTAEATVDAYDESEQRVGFYTMLEECLRLPFETEVLGVSVTVEAIDMTGDEQIVAVCRRGRSKQSIPILDIPLPKPLPEGAEWIEAYRRWARGA